MSNITILGLTAFVGNLPGDNVWLEVVYAGNSYRAQLIQIPAAAGTVTSVDANGGATGLTFSGGPVTSIGTLTLGGTLAVASGGTGAVTISAALANLNLGVVEAHTSDYTLATQDTYKTFSNAAASGTVNFTLPAWSAGLVANFIVEAVHNLTIKCPTGVTINDGGGVTSSGGTLTASVVGSAMTVFAGAVTNTWYTRAGTGTWTPA